MIGKFETRRWQKSRRTSIPIKEIRPAEPVDSLALGTWTQSILMRRPWSLLRDCFADELFSLPALQHAWAIGVVIVGQVYKL